MLLNEMNILATQNRKNGFKVLVVLFGLYFLLVDYKTYPMELSYSAMDEQYQQQAKNEVLIYAATGFFGKMFNFLESDPCGLENFCRLSYNYSDFPNADAVLFHNRDTHERGFYFPEKKGRNIPYVMYTLESQMNEKLDYPANFINWTMSYRIDSDIWAPYSMIIPGKQDAGFQDNIWDLKTKEVGWLVSNCYSKSHREFLVKSLKSLGLQIDIFGKCGKPLPRLNNSNQEEPGSAESTLKQYKFYLSLENSICPDYVTEKFYTALNHYQSIPIVFDRLNHESLGIPASSFIAVDDYENLKKMVDHIQEISKNRSLYMTYHKWRSKYRVVRGTEHTGFCGLCRKLQAGNFKSRMYGDLNEWHSRKHCTKPLLDTGI